MTSDTTPANPAALCPTLPRPKGSAPCRPELGVRSGRTCSPRPFPVATLTVPGSFPHAAPLTGSCLRQSEGAPGRGRGLKPELPCQCRWRPPAGQSGRNLLKGESGGGQERGPARPSQVSAPSGPGEPGPPGADPGRDGVRDGWTHSLGPGPSRGWGEIWC